MPIGQLSKSAEHKRRSPVDSPRRWPHQENCGDRVKARDATSASQITLFGPSGLPDFRVDVYTNNRIPISYEDGI
jgi:hypothetical protein